MDGEINSNIEKLLERFSRHRISFPPIQWDPAPEFLRFLDEKEMRRLAEIQLDMRIRWMEQELDLRVKEMEREIELMKQAIEINRVAKEMIKKQG